MSMVLYFVLLAGSWQFMAVDPEPTPTDRCIQLRELVAAKYTGKEGNMRVICSENGRDV